MATLRIVTSLNDSCCYRHYSVWANGQVYHFNESGAHSDSEEDFMRNRKILRTQETTRTDSEVAAYYEANKNKRYHWFRYNCEHFARGAAFGREDSPTLRGYFTGAAIVATIAAILFIIKRK